MNEYFGVYFLISSYLLPIAVGLFIALQHQSTYSSQLLLTYISITFFVEIIGAILASNNFNNLWLYRIYLYLELTFIVAFFFKQFSKRTTRMFVAISYFVAVTLISVMNHYENWDNHATLQTAISFCFIGFVIIRYFVEMFQTESVINPYKDIHFLVGAIILLGQSSTFIHNVLYNHLIDGYFGNKIENLFYYINFSLILIYNLIYTIALWNNRQIRT